MTLSSKHPKPSDERYTPQQMHSTRVPVSSPPTALPPNPNLPRIFNSISLAIECTTQALSSSNNIRYVAGMTPPDTSRMPNPIDEFVYTEQMLTELLHHLQSARKQLFLLGVNLAEKSSQKVSSD